MSEQYDQYLIEHKRLVFEGFKWIRDNIPQILQKGIDYEWQMALRHDLSKTTQEEYAAYDAYFYGGNRSFEVVNEFNKAWLTHIHRNPHHWQHWVLMNDEPGEGTIALDMPDNYIIEMICDWWAFSWKSGNLYEIFNWYEKHIDYMKLSYKTESRIDDILELIKEKLDEEKASKGDD